MTQPDQNMNHRTFQFQTEFTPDGDILGGPRRKYVPSEEADQLAAAARAEGEAKARQTTEAKGFASIDRVAAHLAPVSAQLAEIADTLRREAAELALITARKIAGKALDEAGDRTAVDAIAETIRLLKADPVVIVAVAPESLAEVERRMEQLRRQGQAGAIRFVGDPQSKPGDWRVEWAEGSAGFSREQVEATIEAVIRARLQDPVEPQLDLFSAA